MKKLVFISLFIIIAAALSAQNVAINSTGATPNSSAMLDVSSTSMGLLIPRIDIPNLSSASPVTSPATSLLVYNTNTTTGVGYYYWDETGWRKLLTDKTAWQLTGNSGTSAATNFIGTTDAVDFVVRTNNIERMKVASGGNVLINTTSALNNTDALEVVVSPTFTTGLGAYGNGGYPVWVEQESGSATALYVRNTIATTTNQGFAIDARSNQTGGAAILANIQSSSFELGIY